MATDRLCARSSADSMVRSANVADWKLRVGRVLIALNASRLASVPSSRYFAVAGPNERLAQVLGRRQHRLAVGHRRPGAALHRDRLDVLRAHHGTQTAAPGVPAVVRDRGVAHAAARRPGRCWPHASRRPCRARIDSSASDADMPHCGAASTSSTPVGVDQQMGRRWRPAGEHDRVVAGELARDREVAGGQRVGEQTGQRRLRDHGELRAGRQRRAHQRREHEGERRGRLRADRRPAAPARSSTRRRDRLRRGTSRSTSSGNARVVVEPSVTSTTRALPK